MRAGKDRISNAEIGELLAFEAGKLDGQLRLALKRAARLSFIWPVEATELLAKRESLLSLPGVGPYIDKRIRAWIETGMRAPEPPAIRRGFLTIPEARRVLARHRLWRAGYQGDLQMHTTWSDGSGTVHEMADTALQL